MEKVLINGINYELDSTTRTASVCSLDNKRYEGDIAILSSISHSSILYDVTSIGSHAFAYCTGLTSITIPNSVTSIGWYAFIYCTGITSITIPNSVTSIGWYAFEDCTGLTSITIPNSVTNIGERAFAGCTGLISFAIPNSVTQIGDNAFSNVPNVEYHGTAMGTPWEAKNVNGYVDGYLVYADATKKRLSCCSTAAIGAITIPNSVTSVEYGAFFGCSGLTSIIIPNSVTNIGWFAFSRCTGLTFISIGNSVTSIGDLAFLGCTSLTSIVVSSDNIRYDSRNHCNAIIDAKSNILIAGCNTTIIPNSVMSIKYKAFYECTELTSIIIPNSVISIEWSAFESCISLTSVSIGNSVMNIGDFAFRGCTSLTSIVVGSGNTRYDSRNNCNAIIETKSNTLVVGCNTTIIPNSVTSIGGCAFSNCIGLTYIEIPNSVTSIGYAAFAGCTGLTSIEIPNSVTSIEDGAFEGCTGLTSVTLPKTITEIGADIFSSCENMQIIRVPRGMSETFCRMGLESWRDKIVEFRQEQQHAARQAQLAQWTTAQKPQKTILFFDTETNGLPTNYKLGISATSNWPRLIQLAWIITDESGNVLKRKSQFIYPQSFTIDADVTRLTGITTADTQRNGVALSDVLSEFMADVESASLLVGHNVDFDMHIIGCELYRMGMNYSTFINKPSVCTMVRSTNFCAIPSTSRYYSGYKFPSLTELYAKLFGHAFSGAHDAISDITATKDCYFELLRRGIV